MYKKVIAINSSRRKQNTYGLLQKIKEDLIQKGIEVDIIRFLLIGLVSGFIGLNL